MKQSVNGATVRLVLGGDVMLGRMVGEHIKQRGADYPLGALAPFLRGCDLTVVNLECAITRSTEVWSGEPKAFYFGAPPAAVHSLLDAGVGGVTLANNHVLDFDVAGLRDTLRALSEHGIGYAGAGLNLTEARAPLLLESNGVTFGIVAYCDHQADFAASATAPGIAYLDLTDEAGALERFRASLDQIKQKRVDWPILSLHWGPNMVLRPSRSFVNLAHAAIDMGYRILFGHSAHVFHGIEIYRGCPILYAAGDVVDDYYVHPQFRNDHQLLFELELTSSVLRGIRLHPVFIDACRVQPATGNQIEYTFARATQLCREMGCRLVRVGDVFAAEIPSGA